MAAGGVLSSCTRDAGQLIPLLIPPDDGSVPGLAQFYASTCLQCPAGCGIHVRVFEGRAKKIEGNPDHPVNRGRLCARGQAALQELYHPDRIQQPFGRREREGPAEPETWASATDRIASRFRELSTRAAGNVLLYTPPLQGIRLELFNKLAVAVRAEHIQDDALNTLVHLTAAREVVGTSASTDYGLAEAQFVLSLGADILETFQSPVRFAEAYGRMRRDRPTVRGLFIYAGPRMSQTAACADEWLPLKPGTEGVLAAGIARYLIENRLYDPASVVAWGLDLESQFKVLNRFDVARVAEMTDLPETRVLRVSRDFGRFRPAVAMAGDGPAAHTNGLDTVQLSHLLNILSGAMGQEARVDRRVHPGSPVPSSVTEMQTAIRRMEQGEILAALFMDVNPLLTLPASLGFRKALAEVPFIISLNTLPNEMTERADIVLPSPSTLERFQDVYPVVRPTGFQLGLAQPVVSPLYEMPSPEDVLIEIVRKVTGNPRESSHLSRLKDRVAATVTDPRTGLENEKWFRALQQGGLWEEQDEGTLASPIMKSPVPAPRLPRFSGTEQQFPFILHLYVSPMLLDGRSAALPWLQEAPDPMTTVQWNSWVEVNPGTAAQLGLVHGDWVEVESPVASIALPVVVFPAIRPDVVAIPKGQGGERGDRYSRGRGANPMVLVSTETDPENDLPAWGATRVRLQKVPSRGSLITSGDPSGSYRGELIGL